VLQGIAYPAFLSEFLFSRLPTIAEHCVWVRVKLGSTGVERFSYVSQGTEMDGVVRNGGTKIR
jgi:hypothetical protein